MKKGMMQSNSTILEDDTGFNMNKGGFGRNKNTLINEDQHQMNEQSSIGVLKEHSNNESFLNNELKSFENNLLLSGGLKQHNKNFAGETFSQISSTFEQVEKHQKVSNQNFYKIQKIGQADKQIISGNDFVENNQDELLDFKILNQCSFNSSVIEVEDNSYMKKQDNLENFKYECQDVLSMLSKISQGLKKQLKGQRHVSSGNLTQSTCSQVNVEDLRSFEILSTSAMEKIRQIEQIGISLYSQNQKPKNSNDIEQKEKYKKYKSHLDKQFMRKIEEFQFQNQINEFELNQRVSQLESALNQQQDEINKQANRNEDLKRQKELLSKQYENRMEDIEDIIKVIIHNLKEDTKSAVRCEKINNSFSIGKSYHSLLQPEIVLSNKKERLRNFLCKDKENKRDNINKQDESLSVCKGSFLDNKKLEGKSLQSQLINLKKIIKEYKKSDFDQQKGGENNGNNSLNNLLQHLFFKCNNDSGDQQSQNIVAQDSCASVNKAFIETINSKSEQSSHNNTSFFGKEMLKEENQQQFQKALQSFEQINRGQHDQVEHQIKEWFQGLSCSQQAILLEQEWLKQQDNDSTVKDRRDANLQELLEISKNSNISSFRTNKMNAKGLNKKQSSDNYFSQALYQDNSKVYNQNSFANLLQQMSNKELPVVKNTDNHSQSVEEVKQERQTNGNHQFLGSLEGSLDLQMGGIAESNRNKNFSDDKDFPDYSIIEGNSVENKKEKTLSLMGSIEKQGGESCFIGGDSLIDMDHAFLPDNKEFTQPMPVMTIKIQDREIQMPQLNLKKAIALENRENYKFNQVQDYVQSSDSSISIQEQPSSFQNESISKHGVGTDKFKHTNHEDTLDLDKAIIVEEVKKEANNQSSEEESLGQIEFMFGSFQKELQQEEEKNKDAKDDTLDFNDDNFSNIDSGKNKDQAFMSSKESTNPIKNIDEQNQIKVERIEEVKERGVSSQNNSYLKKSHSDSQLINLADVNVICEDNSKVKIELGSVPEQLKNFIDSNKDSERIEINQESEVNIVQKKRTKTPKNGIKINFNQNKLLNNQGIKLIINKQQQNHTKQRSTSSETKKKEIQKVEERNSSDQKPRNIKIITQYEDDDSKFGSDKKSIKIRGMLKVNKIQSTKNEQSQEQSKILHVKKVFKHDGLERNSFVSKDKSMCQSFMEGKVRKAISIKRKEQANAAQTNESSFQVYKNFDPDKIPTSNSPFQDSPIKNQRQSKSLVQPKKISTISKLQIYKNGCETNNQVTAPKKRLSIQRRRVQEIQKNNLVNQTEIFDPSSNQSVIHKQSFIQNTSQIVMNQNESIMINKTIMDESRMSKQSQEKKIIKIARKSHERKNAMQKQRVEPYHQPIQLVSQNIMINEAQLTSQKSIPKLHIINQKVAIQPYSTNDDHSKSMGQNSSKAHQLMQLKQASKKVVSQQERVQKRRQSELKQEDSGNNVKQKRPQSSKQRKKSGTEGTMQVLKKYKQQKKEQTDNPLSAVSSNKQL